MTEIEKITQENWRSHIISDSNLIIEPVGEVGREYHLDNGGIVTIERYWGTVETTMHITYHPPNQPDRLVKDEIWKK